MRREQVLAAADAPMPGEDRVCWKAARTRRAAVAPTVAATEKFLIRLGGAFPGTVWVGGCKNWYTGDQGTPVLWPLPQRAHQAFFEGVSKEDFQFIPTELAD